MEQMKLVFYVDVDDTLVRSFGSKRIPMTEMVNHIQKLKNEGAELYCWSSGGADYARRSAQELGLESCFLGFLPKPYVMLDDMEPSSWKRLVTVHPAEAPSKSLIDYRASLGPAV
jgi:hypothetical protein